MKTVLCLLGLGLVVTAMAACSVHVVGQDAGAPCPPPSPGQCPPTPCTGGVQQTGQSSCQDGQWVCAQQACTEPTPSCDQEVELCVAGDADCAPVYQGSLCSQCWCANAAISKTALPAYQSDVEAAGPPVSTCDCPASRPPVCDGGICTIP
jgi:hypothetical protein